MGAIILETDPLDILLDADGDIVIDNQGLHFATGLSGVAQLIRTRVLMFAGEWFLNLDVGIPWYDTVFADDYDERTAYDALRAEILGTPGVVSIVSLTLTRDPFLRTVAIAYECTVSFGDTVSDTLDLTKVLNG
jgi:hypothetical protein